METENVNIPMYARRRRAVKTTHAARITAVSRLRDALLASDVRVPYLRYPCAATIRTRSRVRVNLRGGYDA